MSSIENEQADQVRSKFSKGEKPADKRPEAKPVERTEEKPVKKPMEKAEAKSEEAPKKKNIVHVFRPQNTQKGVRQGGNSNGSVF